MRAALWIRCVLVMDCDPVAPCLGALVRCVACLTLASCCSFAPTLPQRVPLSEGLTVGPAAPFNRGRSSFHRELYTGQVRLAQHCRRGIDRTPRIY
jgi:hypothetical protein